MTRFLFVGAGLILITLVCGAEAQTSEGPAETGRSVAGDVFRLPALADGLRRFRALLQGGKREEAAETLDRLRTTFSDAEVLDVAEAALLDGEIADPAALQALAAFAVPVVDCPSPGPVGPGAAPRAEVEPSLVSENRAPVTAANTRWDPRLQRLRSAFAFPPILKRKPITEDGTPKRGRLPAPVLHELQGWFLRGRAAGLAGTVFDNRDRGHSGLPKKAWPQLAFTHYSEAARAAGLDYGLNTDILFDAPTIGNSSTAITGSPFWRSQARLALTSPEGPERLFQLYAHDHVYVFPEHTDHDPLEPGEEPEWRAGRKGDLSRRTRPISSSRRARPVPTGRSSSPWRRSWRR